MSGPWPSLAADDVNRLRDALVGAGYTVDGVRGLLGERAAGALDRNETTPGRLVVAGGSPLETLTALWPLQLPVSRKAAERVLPLSALIDGGFLAPADPDVADDAVRAIVDVRPYADDSHDWWLVADLTPGLDGAPAAVPNDHVLGVGSASTTLAQLTVRTRVGRALDLGTGSGIQSLHLAQHCATVVATDVNRRALALAAVTARLNEIDIELREGSFFDPVREERFDLIVSNPPFVVSPEGSHAYRDGGLEHDAVSQLVIVQGADRLGDGGILHTLANWLHVRGEDWRDRVGRWVGVTGCDALVLQRDVLDPAQYVELWLRDSGDVGRPDYQAKYERWLSWFDAHGVDGVGFGWVSLRRSGRDQPLVRLDDWPHPVEQPLGSTVAAWFGRAGLAQADDAVLLGSRLVVADDVRQELIGRPGDDDPEQIVLRQRRGLRRAVDAGTAEAGLVGACDGSVPVGQLIDAIARLLDVDAHALRAQLMPKVRGLVADGFLLPGSREIS